MIGRVQYQGIVRIINGFLNLRGQDGEICPYVLELSQIPGGARISIDPDLQLVFIITASHRIILQGSDQFNPQ